MAWWIWIVLGALLLAAEAFISADFFLVFFGISGILVGLLGLVGVDLPVWGEFLLFAALAVFGLVIYRDRWKKRLSRPDQEMGPELVGEAGRAREAIPAGARGKVDLRGSAWEAKNDGPSDVAAGERVVVERVEGLTLHVRPES